MSKEYTMKVNTHQTLLSDILVSNFGDILSNSLGETSRKTSLTPRIDLSELKEHYELIVQLPGISKEAISITQEDNTLRVSADRNEKENAGKKLLTEMHYGKFDRVIRLPKNANLSAIEASYEQGLLTISIDKKMEAMPRTIEIK